MAKDTRLYARFALDTPDDPKIAGLSDAAFRLWFDATCWSRKHLTDGFIADRLADRLAAACVFDELCANHGVRPSMFRTEKDGESGYQIHDFAEHQDTKAEVEARRAQAKHAGQIGGKANAKRFAKQPEKRSAKRSEKQNRSIDIDIDNTTPSTPNGVPGVGAPAERNGAHAAATPGPPPPCKIHGTAYAHDEPCTACMAQRKWQEQQNNSRPTPQPEQFVPQGPKPVLSESGYAAMADIQAILKASRSKKTAHKTPDTGEPEFITPEEPW